MNPTSTIPSPSASDSTTAAAASQFLAAWDHGWNTHDAHALAALHTTDAVTVNRYGTLILGRLPAEQALGHLHSKQGPFGNSTFPPLQLIQSRQIAAGVIVLQASWKAPVMHPDGNISDTEWDNMIVTFVLVRDGQMWKVSEIDGHNIETMDLPYSNPGQQR